MTIFAAAVAAAFAAKGIIQLPITSHSRRDHSVFQTSASRNSENSEHRRCGLSAGKRVMRVYSAGEVWYLRLPCCRGYQYTANVRALYKMFTMI